MTTACCRPAAAELRRPRSWCAVAPQGAAWRALLGWVTRTWGEAPGPASGQARRTQRVRRPQHNRPDCTSLAPCQQLQGSSAVCYYCTALSLALRPLIHPSLHTRHSQNGTARSVHTSRKAAPPLPKTHAHTHLIGVRVLHQRQRLARLVCCAHAHQHHVRLVRRVPVHNHALHGAVVLLDDVDSLAHQAVRVCAEF